MKRAPLAAGLALASLLALPACRDSSPMPPGNWTGRCPAPDPRATEFGPPPTTFVRDEAKVFTQSFVTEVERALTAFQLETCHQLLLVSVDLQKGQALDRYALDYANRVGLGYRRLNNGVMLVLSPNSAQARIQIGCGLEDVISDAQANAILQQDLLPALGQESWQKGVADSLTSLMELARKKPVPEQFRPKGCRAAQASAK